MPRPHPPEFRQRAVELARMRDKPVVELARDLGISESCLRKWMAQADRATSSAAQSRIAGSSPTNGNMRTAGIIDVVLPEGSDDRADDDYVSWVPVALRARRKFKHERRAGLVQ